MDKLAFEIGVADGIEKTAISRELVAKAMRLRRSAAVNAAVNDTPDFKKKLEQTGRMYKRVSTWNKGKDTRQFLHKRTGAGMEQLLRRADEVKKSPVADKVVGSSKKKNIAKGLGAAAGIGALGAGAYGVTRALKDD